MRPQTLQRIKRSYYLVTFLFWFATILPGAVSVLLVQARGLDLFQIGIFLGIYSLTIVLLEIPTGGLADAVGRKRVTVFALLFILASLITFLFAFSLPLFLLYALLAGAGRALVSGALEAWFIDSLLDAEPGADLSRRSPWRARSSLSRWGRARSSGVFCQHSFPACQRRARRSSRLFR